MAVVALFDSSNERRAIYNHAPRNRPAIGTDKFIENDLDNLWLHRLRDVVCRVSTADILTLIIRHKDLPHSRGNYESIRLL